MRRDYWRAVEESFMPPGGAKRRKKRRKTDVPEPSPVFWTRGEGHKRKCGASDDLIDALSGFPENKPVVLWTTSHWSDRLILWWIFDSIDRAGLHDRREEP
jgi:hypothetical protein